MALTQTDLANLDTAIASAELEVQLEGRKVKYRSTDELLKARAHVAGVLNGAASGGVQRATFRHNFTTSRGE
ncbi:MAG: hypothetical protein EOP39_30550 [Rubrivivax sp.]|nr:MAG: hypothetical protein EOP39_30550 [Rubrivivax sp.]